MDRLHIGQHISQQFNEELEALRNRVLHMGGVVEHQIGEAIRALVEGDSALGEEVANNDYKVNELEVQIDEQANHILARRQPAASDLRLVVAIIKTITDLERIGDEAEKIGRMAARLAAEEQPAQAGAEIEHLGNRVRRMLQSSLDAFARLDADAAVKVARKDEKVDSEYEGVMRQLITFMMEDPRTIRRALDAMWCARSLERIGDHARNISEYVVFLVGGRDVRHTTIEQMEQVVVGSGAEEDRDSSG